MDLYNAEVERFVDYLCGLAPEQWQARAEFAGEMVTMDRILGHVVRSGLGWHRMRAARCTK